MSQDTRSLVTQILENAERVNAASRERSEFVSKLADRSRTIGGEIDILRLQTGDMREKLHSATSSTNQISGEVRSIVETLVKVEAEIAALSARLDAYREEFAEVENFTSAIREISERTEMLSFNALIESARASEKGNAFHIVAKEIRELSDLTRDRANSITKTIGGLSKNFGSLLDACEQMEGRAKQSNVAGKKSLTVLQSVGENLAMTARDAENSHTAVCDQLQSLAGLSNEMDLLHQDTIAAIDGSAKNIGIAEMLQQRLPEGDEESA